MISSGNYLLQQQHSKETATKDAKSFSSFTNCPNCADELGEAIGQVGLHCDKQTFFSDQPWTWQFIPIGSLGIAK